MAEKCDRVKVAVDPFCGAGGNIIQLARMFDKVIAVDIDVDKIVMAKQNAAIYGVLEKIDFVVGDFFKLENQIKGDVIVTSPPWGGPEYNKMDVIENVFMERYLKSTLLYVRSNNNNGVSDVAPKPVDILTSICITHSTRMSGIV
ncbi:trimethylguanosine synthase-like [Metopolophium dirhodum]|uniref:trimethylguanosine synthase-like n=1 Tax=Metopolophium dirhodum TaxID=44670 RepID=UPI00298FA63A|nr:trimethylguanosine synthase-like [Metopolophium dirhodum]XP_060866015.1 trimethylguanosine synthase-like [Metopolophium dirhodum]